MTTNQNKPSSNLGLDELGDLSSYLGAPSSSNEITKPLELELGLIDEDIDQPRTVFDVTTLNELADTIRERGIKTPISVRINPNDDKRFVINHGARRYRASLLAGKKTIPAFIDPDYTQADQVIENIQRDNLTSREIADFIGRKLSEGLKKQAVAKLIGKSNAFITQHVTLLNLPAIVADLFNSGRITDITIISEVVKAYKQNPDEITLWLGNKDQEINRNTIKLMRECLTDSDNKKTTDNIGSTAAPTSTVPAVKQIQAVKKIPDHNKEVKKRLENLIKEFYLNYESQDRSISVFEQLNRSEKQQLETILLKLIRIGNS